MSSIVAPTATGAASNCQSSYNGQFGISVVNTTESKRSISLEKRQGTLLLTLTDGVLRDAQDRVGYIASNYQFQFDSPVQNGTIYASGWAVCPNGELVLGSESVYYQCASGTFYNLYTESQGAQCNAVNVYVLRESTSTTASGAGAITTSVSTSAMTAASSSSAMTSGTVPQSNSDGTASTTTTGSAVPSTSEATSTPSSTGGAAAARSSPLSLGAAAGSMLGAAAIFVLLAV